MEQILTALHDLADSPQDNIQATLGELWNGRPSDRVFEFSQLPATDYYAELLGSLERREDIFHTSLPTSLSTGAGEESAADGGYGDDETNEPGEHDEFGIEIPDPINSERYTNNTPLTPESPSYPWPSMAMFLTDLLFSSPRLRFSEQQKAAVLTWGKELGACDVPSLGAVKRCQEHIRDLVGNPTEKVESRSGTIFYINDVGKAIAKDYANPLTRSSMEDYPIDGDGGMSQVFHAEKMLLEMPAEHMAPTVRVDGEIYFVNELLQLASDDYFIPERFFAARPSESRAESSSRPSPTSAARELYALGRLVARSNAGFLVSVEERVIAPISTFRRTFEEIRLNADEFSCGFTECSKSYGEQMPHPFRAKSGGRMVYSVPLIIFMDDVSGNISKQWNKHHVIYMSNANMPREMIEKEFCVRFVSSSPNATPMELMTAMKTSVMKAADAGVVAWDCRNNEEVMLCPYGLFWAGDNPMQAEECSHAGLGCNYFCRTCKVGGTKEYKASNDGFQKIFVAGEPRTPAETIQQICEQIKLSLLSGGTTKVKDATAATGIRDATTDSIKLRQKQSTGSEPGLSAEEIRVHLEKEFTNLLSGETLENSLNPLLGMPGVDIHQDTPTEILHTLLLGVVKYFWGQTVWLLAKSKLMGIFQTRLASISTAGLNDPTLGAEYICQYKGGLIGKHFKSLAQVMPYVVYDLVPQTVLDGWTAIGALVVLLWHTEIKNTEAYLAELSRLIEDFLNITALCSPSILISKPKFHFLVHLPAYIRRFGPAVLFSTERYESFNHIFRLSSIYSNRQAPSRDTCNAFAAQDIMKHLATGGYWFDNSQRKWVHAGHEILAYVSAHPSQARLLGLKTERFKEPGRAKIPPPVRNENGKISPTPSIPWSETLCSKIQSHTQCQQTQEQGIDNSTRYYKATAFIAHQGDKVCNDNFVLFTDKSTVDTLLIGQVNEILVPLTSDVGHSAATHIAVHQVEFLPSLHPQLRVPCLKSANKQIILAAKDIICTVNVQHDCSTCGCKDVLRAQVRQENAETRKTHCLIQHATTYLYTLNTFSLHNHRLIASIIPAPLRLRAPAVLDSQAVRENAATLIRQKKSQGKASATSGCGEDGLRTASGNDCGRVESHDTGQLGDKDPVGDAAAQDGEAARNSGGNTEQNSAANTTLSDDSVTNTVPHTNATHSMPVFEHAQKKPAKRKGSTIKDQGPTTRKRKKKGAEVPRQTQVASSSAVPSSQSSALTATPSASTGTSTSKFQVQRYVHSAIGSSFQFDFDLNAT
ncbi:hypothetical protein B0H21DRAFT_889914 [Amylocystis lapponica]|nr:hypothetical protein B0H21DRAFT_889914 [Amylocystis lapponica]